MYRNIPVDKDNRPVIDSVFFNTEIDPDEIKEIEIDTEDFGADTFEFIEEHHDVCQKLFELLALEEAIYQLKRKKVTMSNLPENIGKIE
jgi:hypothetical protein